MQIVKRYDADQVSEICALFGKLVLLLDSEPQDVLGQLYIMALELGNTQAGQFFTPHEISELMARITYGDELQNLTKPFITLSEPACGAGGMVLAFVRVMLSHGHDPAKRLWVPMPGHRPYSGTHVLLAVVAMACADCGDCG